MPTVALAAVCSRTRRPPPDLDICVRLVLRDGVVELHVPYAAGCLTHNCRNPVIPLATDPDRPGHGLADTGAEPRAVTHAGLVCVRKSVKMAVVPEPSERWATAIGVFGSDIPGFSAAMAGSFHTVIPPEKIFPMVWPSNSDTISGCGRL